MFHSLRSLRVRLVVTLAAVVGMISALLGMGGVMLREWQLRGRFDQQLGDQASRAAIDVRRRLDAGVEPAVLFSSASSPRFANLFLQLTTPQGDVIAQSPELRSTALVPLPPGAFRTVSPPPRPRHADGRPIALRITTQRIMTADGETLLLTAAGSYEQVLDALAFLRLLFWVVVPSSVVVTALAGWIVTGRAMVRLDQLSDLARHITPGRLDQRIEISPRDDEISRLAGEVNHMLGRLESSFKAQERFIANASHELQTPIAVLLSEAQLLKDAQPPPTPGEYHGFVRSVEQEMRQLTRMVGSLLSLVRMESGELQRAETLVSLNEVLATAVDDCRAAADRQGATVRLTLPDPDASQCEPVVIGDAGLLQIMVENLLRNAIRNSPTGGGVFIALELDVDQAVITVTDQGATLSAEALRTAFDRSRPAAPTAAPTTGRQGSGLELAIARTIAELHHGAIGARPPDPSDAAHHAVGAAFFVCLPLAPGDQHA